MKSQSPKPFLVLDRDGTLIVEKHYLSHPRDVELIPGAGDCIKRFREIGWGAVVLTNQSGIARGMFGEAEVHAVHQRIHALLAEQGATIDGYYFCGDDPKNPTTRRKPGIGMADEADQDWGINWQESIVIGDKISDLELGWNLGANVVLVRTGYGRETERELTLDRKMSAKPLHVLDSLANLTLYLRHHKG